jgi:hypothetical protein
MQYYNANGTSFVINNSSAGALYAVTQYNKSQVILNTATTPDMTQYLNGASIGTASGATSGASSNPLRIGRAAGATTSNLDGSIFSLLIYASELTTTQLQINEAVDEWALGGTFPLTP